MKFTSLVASLAALGVAVGVSALVPASAAPMRAQSWTFSDSTRDGPTRDGDISKVKVTLQRSSGSATVEVTFVRNPDSFFYLDIGFGKNSYGMCSFAGTKGAVWLSFDPYQESSAMVLQGKAQNKSVDRTGSTTWRYRFTSPQLQTGNQNCIAVESGFFADSYHYDSDCDCVTRIDTWDTVEGRIS